MSERIDITEPTAEICRRLGLTPDMVASLEWTPGQATAVVYLANENGRKYLGEDDKAATETLSFSIRT